MSFITLAGHTMQIESDIISVPCLTGEDTTREPGRINVQAKRGEPLAWIGFGEPLEIKGEEPLQGWGKLDGPAYVISAMECAWTVSIPQTLIDALAAWSGASIEGI